MKSAFKEAAAQDIAELEAMDIEICYPTEKQRREIERAARKVERKASSGFGHAWRAVAMVVIVCCIGCGVLMMQPSVRASVWDVVVSFFEKYFTFDANGDAPRYEYPIGDYMIGYVPAGYELQDQQETPYKVAISFKSNEGEFLISVYTIPFSRESTDNENTTIDSVSIGEMPGYLIQYQNSNMNKLTWGDETHTFSIKGEISEKEIIRIAESIR